MSGFRFTKKTASVSVPTRGRCTETGSLDEPDTPADGGAVRDRSIADSWFGLYLPLLISASEQVAREMSSKGELLQPTTVDPHPKLVEFWQREGLSTLNGMPLEQQGGGGRTAEEQG
jgi:hypothetical protein